MNEEEKELVSECIVQLYEAISKRNISALKILGAEFASDAFIHESRYLVDLSIISYSFSKFLEKPYISSSILWVESSEEVLSNLGNCLNALNKNDFDSYSELISNILSTLEDVSSSLGRFSTSVIFKARIKAAAQIYAHGASLGRAAEIAGIDEPSLSSYVGVTRLHEKYKTYGVRERLSRIESLFD